MEMLGLFTFISMFLCLVYGAPVKTGYQSRDGCDFVFCSHKKLIPCMD